MTVVVNVGSLGAAGFTIQGDSQYDYAGTSVSNAGDVNGDGFDDFLIGVPAEDEGIGHVNSGRVYVVFGKGTAFSDFDLTTFSTGSDGFVVIGDVGYDQLGFSVSAAGDVNGDGFADIVLGAPHESGNDPGAAYVIFGHSGAFSSIDLGTVLPGDVLIIEGDKNDDGAGWSVSSAGDINGDGFDDVIVGARYGGASLYGAAYVVFGHGGPFGTVDLASLGSAGFTINGQGSADKAGFSVSGAGDVNGDGFDDVMVSVPYGDDGGSNSGETVIIFGHSGAFDDINAGAPLTADLGFIIQGDAAGDQSGHSVSDAGDVNGDGYDDVIIGAWHANDGGELYSGAAYVVFGKASGIGTIDLASLAATDGFRMFGDGLVAEAGSSVSSAGDVNGDGFDDIIVGSPRADTGAGGQTGAGYVVYGRASGFGAVDLDNLADADGFIIQGDSFALLGTSVSSAGDINGDGFDEVMVGAVFDSTGGDGAGAVHVIYGVAPTTAVTRIGAGGDQTIRGGAFNDTLDGLGGADTLIGAGGDDSYYVDNAGDQVIEAAGQGNDKVFASLSYTLGAGQSIETLQTTANGGTGAIDLTGNALANTLIGNAGANVLTGGGGGDVLIGFGGNDTLVGSAGSSSTLQGGLGNDIYRVFIGSDTIIEVAGEGTDRINTSASFVLLAGREIESLFAADLASTTALNLTGNSFGQTLFGNAGANVLVGGGGGDYLIGGAGNDILYGNADANSTLQGGVGDDRYYVSRTGDSLVEFAGEGSDRVLASINYTLTAGKEIEELSTANPSGTTALNLTGNELAQTIIGNNGANILSGLNGADNLAGFGGSDILVGGDGDDTLNGGADYDIMNGGTGADVFIYASPFGPALADRIQDFVSGLDRIFIDDAQFAGLATGALPANAFRTGSAALDADDRIIYNPASGALLFDADGNGAGAAVQFGVLSGAPALAASDFTVI